MFDFLEIIDLSYNMKNGMLTYNAPWHPSFSIKQLAQIKVEGRETRKVSFGTHTGTHIDAPRHFIEQGNTVEKIPLEKLIGKVTIIDFSNLKEKECITAEMLKSLNISEKIIFKFGWGKYYGSDKLFGSNTTDIKVTGGLQHIHGGWYCRFQGSSMTQNDLWEVEVYSETRKISNAESGAVQLTRRGYSI